MQTHETPARYGSLLWGVVVETECFVFPSGEIFLMMEIACHGFRSRTKRNATLFGPPGHWYVYLTYGIHHCVNVVTDRDDWANGVLLRAIALPQEPPRIAAARLPWLPWRNGLLARPMHPPLLVALI